MIYGTIATIICINLLSWTSEIVWLCCHMFGISTHGYGAKLAVQILAIAGVWALNIAVQPVQSSIRALIVDVCSASQATRANSFASFIIIIGSAIGYGCGFIRIPRVVGSSHNTQFKGLCVIASFALGITVAVTCMVIKDKPANITSTGYGKSGILRIWKEIRKTLRSLPLNIKTVCLVQFFAWLAWFPFLFNNVL
jgi:solute carrier family 45 protein 1/2/4